MQNSKVLQLDFGFSSEPINKNPKPKTNKKSKDDFPSTLQIVLPAL